MTRHASTSWIVSANWTQWYAVELRLRLGIVLAGYSRIAGEPTPVERPAPPGVLTETLLRQRLAGVLRDLAVEGQVPPELDHLALAIQHASIDGATVRLALPGLAGILARAWPSPAPEAPRSHGESQGHLYAASGPAMFGLPPGGAE